MYEKAGWTTIPTAETVTHVLPSHDVIEHRENFICICKPYIEHEVWNDRVYWREVHNSFDEFLDEDQVEPYRGL